MHRTRWACVAVLGLVVSLPGTAQAQSQWQEEPVPEPSATAYGTLATVAAGHGEVWAFGSGNDSYPLEQSLAYQRGPDGWQEVPVPDVGRLYDSEVVGPGDVWAVGEPVKAGGGTPLHWNGAEWVETAFTPPEGHLFDMGRLTAFAPDDVWAVGGTGVNGAETYRGFVQHWDGAAWSEVPVPEGVATRWSLNDVDGAAPDDVWAVGDNLQREEAGAVALHWDGTEWTNVPMPAIVTSETQRVDVTEVEALAPNDVWATGNIVSYDENVPTEPVLLHWNGAEWSLAEGPQDGLSRGELVQVGSELWSLGERLWHYDGTRWQETLGPTQGVPSGGAADDAGQLFLAGGKGRLPAQKLPFVVTRTP